MGQALYRKHRSMKLGDVVGQEHITKALEGSLQSGRISHAYLFTGPRGVGKTSIARILAHEINNLPYTDEETHLDIIEIDAASNRRIDDIRDLREKVHIAPVSAKYKVYIIDEVHMLTSESFNALLKTLEEPPEHVVFILATTELHKLPATIVSRTQRYSFRLVDQQKVVKHLRSIAKKEKIEVDDEALELIAEFGEGSFRDSIGLLDQLANVVGDKITVEVVENMLGLAPQAAMVELLDSVKKGNHKAVAAKLKQLESHGTGVSVLVTQLLVQLRKEAVAEPRFFLLIDQLLDVPKAHNPALKLLTTLMSFTLGQAPAEPKRTAAAAAPPKPLLEISAVPKNIKKIVSPPAEPTKKAEAIAPKAPTTHNTGNLQALSAEDWAKIVNRCKEVSPPLHSVVRQAQPTFDPQTQTLTLAFRFALHSKKLDDAKHKSKLAAVITEIMGSCPEIMTSLQSSTPTASSAGGGVPQGPPQTRGATASMIGESGSTGPAAPATTEIDEKTRSVLDMMGGGEIVHAETV